MRPRPPTLGATTAAMLASLVVLAGCSSSGGNGPDWSPQPAFSGDGGGSVQPELPGGPITPVSPVAPPTGSPSTGGSAKPVADPTVVATNLAAPVGLVILPDGTALVGERTTGRIVQVQPVAGRPVRTVRTLTGLDTAGDGGLLDLALSPSYPEDQLLFAYITTATDNRVVDFTLTGPITPVLTGIPRGTSGNTGRITFGSDGDLYIGTGDAGVPANVTNPHSLAGKVLRVNSIGKPTGSPVFTTGEAEIDGLCTDPDTGTMVATQARPAAASDDVRTITDGPAAALRSPPAASRGVGGCAIESGVLYVASRDGRELIAASLTERGTTVTLGGWTPYVLNRYGRLRTVVAAPDGALWMTTSNRDGHGHPIATDERVIRILPPSRTSTNPL